MYSAEQHLQAAREHLLDARSAISDVDSDAALAAVDAAKVESSAAADLAGNPAWALAAAVPKLGDTPDAAKSLVLAADAAVTGVAGLADAAGKLADGDLYNDGTVDLDAVAPQGRRRPPRGSPSRSPPPTWTPCPPRPSGGWVLPQVDDARTELADQITELTSATEAMEKAGTILPGVLGAEEPKKYFVAVQSPNETRGTGGIVGTWAVLEADKGRISVSEVGSNREFRTLAAIPDSMDADFVARYGQDPRKFDNMNLSPDFPSAATCGLPAGRPTGRGPRRGPGLDVVALGNLLDRRRRHPQGAGRQDPDRQAVRRIRARRRSTASSRPTPRPLRARPTRRPWPSRRSRACSGPVTPRPCCGPCPTPVKKRRVAAWVEDPEAMAVIADSVLGHSLQPAEPHSVEPAVINAGWSKLDTYIDREYDYVVGRCPDENGMVTSQLTMTLTSDLPEEDLPEYVVGAVPVGPDGPINRVVLQAHLPPGAEILDVTVDGESFSYWPFTEAGRPAFGELLDLPPREARTVSVTFLEPADDAPGEVLKQPMARGADITVSDKGC